MQQTEILKQIRSIQINADPAFFSPGLFPSFRKNTFFGLSHPDDNLFFSISIAYILQTLYPNVSTEEKTIIDNIINDLLPCLPEYTNNQERYSFNFWKKQENKHFPNGLIAHRLNKFKLPDDIDTTSLAQIVANFPIHKSAKTKNALIKHANTIHKTIQNGHKELRNYKAYSTWFGENMPIEFDVCVLSNLLLWINHYSFDLNSYDNDTIELIKYTITHSLYNSPFKSAPEYPQKTIILYHLARATSITPYLTDCKQQLIKDITETYKNSKNNMEKVILQTSLLKLKIVTEQTILLKNILLDINNSWWFTAGFASAYSTFPLPSIAPLSIFHFRFYSPAFNLCLLYENMVLNNL